MMTNAARYCWRAVGGLVCAGFVAAGLGAWRFLRDPFPSREYNASSPWSEARARECMWYTGPKIPLGVTGVCIHQASGPDTYLYLRFIAQADDARQFIHSVRWERIGEGEPRPPSFWIWPRPNAPAWWTVPSGGKLLYAFNGTAGSGPHSPDDLPTSGECVIWHQDTSTVYYHYWNM